VLAKLRFSKPAKGGGVEVRYSLSFDPGLQTGAFASLTGTGDISWGSRSRSSGFDETELLLGGLSASGAGGGGTGWGTIGTAGTIGHGSGTGSGYGSYGRGRAVATVSLGDADAKGDLDKAIIRRYIRRDFQKLRYCYEKELLTDKRLGGTVTAEFTIAENGKVRSSTASGMKNTNVETCIASVIKRIEFPKPIQGTVSVKYPMTFQPAGKLPPAKQ
jgi:hypothetical protein